MTIGGEASYTEKLAFSLKTMLSKLSKGLCVICRTLLVDHAHTNYINRNPASKAKASNQFPPPPSASPYGAAPPPASPYANPATSSLPYNYPPPPAMYQPPPAGGYAPLPPPGQAVYAAQPPVQGEPAAEDSKGKKFAKKFGSQVASGAAWGVGMSGK